MLTNKKNWCFTISVTVTVTVAEACTLHLSVAVTTRLYVPPVNDSPVSMSSANKDQSLDIAKKYIDCDVY